MASVPATCPTCNRPLPAGAFMCPRCELIVDGGQVERDPLPPHEPSVVFALLAPADSKLERPAGPPAPPPSDGFEDDAGEVESRPTAGFGAPPDPRAVPSVLGVIDPKRYSLTTFEAWLVSLMDGTVDVELLGRAAGLKLIEVQAVLHSLVQRKVVTLASPASRPAAGTAAAPAPARPPTSSTPASGGGGPSALQQAIGLEKNGDFKGAIRVLAKAIESADQPAPLYNRLALVVIKERRDFTVAESLLRKACDLDPKREVFAKNLAMVQQFAARIARARGEH